jgi:EmrB/QacA subfamily drug resistance transporter
MTGTDRPERLDTRTRIALGAMSLAVFVIANDITSLSVALPRIERDFGVDVSTVQWVMNAYTLGFGVLIVTGGRLSDILGRRRTFFMGVTVFALCSAVAAVAGSAGVLIAARAAMAIGAALIWPSVVGLIFGLVPPARAGLAGGLLLGVSGIGNALGPMVGGFLTDRLSWRWILVLNLPIAAAAITLVALYIDHDAPAETRERLDWAGVTTLSVGLVTLLVALDQASDWGWGDPRIIGLLIISVVSLVALVITQRRGGRDALVPRDVIGTRAFASACVTIVLVSGIWFAVLLYAPQYMEKILGFSALRAGVAFLPMLLTFSVTAFTAGWLYNHMGPRLPLLCGTACMPLGALLLSLVGTSSPYLTMVPGLIVVGIGVGLFYSTVTNAALTALDPSRTGLGSGLTFMFQLVSGALGVAIATTVFTSVSRSHPGAHVGFVAGLHAGLRLEAAIAVCGLATVWWVGSSTTSTDELDSAEQLPG